MTDINKIKEGLNDAVNWGHITHSFSNLILHTIRNLQRELAIKEEDLYNKQHEIDVLKERLELVREQREIVKDIKTII
jgi:hypothetical protein